MLLEELCDKRIKSIPEEDLDKVFSAVPCDQLDQDLLKEFRIDDCPALLYPTVVEIESHFCDADVFSASWGASGPPGKDVEDNCGWRNDDGTTETAAKFDACKPAMEAAVKEWEPHDVESMDQEGKDEQVRTMAVVMACKSLKIKEYDPDDVREKCEDMEDELKDFGYDMAACSKYWQQKALLSAHIICFIHVVHHLGDAGVDFQKMTFQDLKDAVDLTKEDIDFLIEEKWSIMDPRVAEKLVGSIGARRWSPGSAAALSAAAALALAAMGGVAWRLHRGRGSPSPSSSSSVIAGEEETTGTEQLVS